MRERLTKIYSVSVTPSVYAKVRENAERIGVTTAEYIRLALDERIENDEKRHKETQESVG